MDFEQYLNSVKNLDTVYKVLIGFAVLITAVFGIFSWSFFIFVGGPILLRIYLKWTTGITKTTRRIDGKVAIVTGANIGLGYETAKDLARRGGKIIMACRNVNKGNEAANEIKKAVPDANLIVMKLDLSSLKSVREFANKFKSDNSRLDILVNNAGGTINERSLTEDNIEMNFAANHFGPFLLTNSLLGLLKKTGNARIVVVSSQFHALPQSLDLDDLNSEKSFQPTFIYGRTKLANILFTRELDRRFRANGISEITVNALHPGSVKTAIIRNAEQLWYKDVIKIYSLFRKTAWEGAQTQIHLAVADEVEELSGLYWSDCQERGISKLAQDPKLAKALWAKSVQVVGLKPKETIFDQL